MTLGHMIFDLVYNIYSFDQDVVIVFTSTSWTKCIYCDQRVGRQMEMPHYTTCTCGKRYLFRRHELLRPRR